MIGRPYFAQLLLGCLGLLAGCSTLHYEVNPPLSAVAADKGYRLHRFIDADADDHFYMQVTVSGGGARAAALLLEPLFVLGLN